MESPWFGLLRLGPRLENIPDADPVLNPGLATVVRTTASATTPGSASLRSRDEEVSVSPR
jgi:hypothetical protein